MGGMQDWRDVGLKGCRKGRDSGEEVCRKGGIQERWYSMLEKACEGQ